MCPLKAAVMLAACLATIQTKLLAQTNQTAYLPQPAWSLDTGLNLTFQTTMLAADPSDNLFAYGSSLLLKYDPDGNLLWAATNSNVAVVALRVDASGNAYLAGNDGAGFATAKYNPSGRLLWETNYPQFGTSAGTMADARLDAFGNLIMCGTLTSGSTTNYLTVKADGNGNLFWSASYEGPLNSDSARALAVDPQGGIYVTGGSAGFGTGQDVVTVKYNPAGQQQWVARYNGPGNLDETGVAVVVDSAGYVLVEATDTFPSHVDTTLRYDTQGIQVWAAPYVVYGFNAGFPQLASDGSGGAYVAALFYVRSNGGSIHLWRYDSAGNVVFDLNYQGFENTFDNYDTVSSLATDTNDNVYLACVSSYLKVSPSGQILWDVASLGSDPLLDSQGDVFASDGSGLVKYIQTPVTAPAARLLTPTDGTTLHFPVSVPIQVVATEQAATMELWDGDLMVASASPPFYLYDWNVPGGDHTLTARFTSQSGIRATSAPVHLVIVTNVFPLVSITNPPNGAYFVEPASFTVGAQASSADSTVASVVFFAGSQQIGQAAASPYQIPFSNVPAGSYTLTAQATDNLGAVGVSTPVKITVLPENSPPLIVHPPTSSGVPLGGSFSLSVQAYGGAPLSYQWQLNNTNLPGQTNAQVTVSNAQRANAGDYQVTVTNPFGQATSGAAVSLFSTNLLFTSIQSGSGGSLVLEYSAPLGAVVSISTSTNLLNWTLLQQVTATNQNLQFSYPVGAQPATRFFRLSMP